MWPAPVRQSQYKGKSFGSNAPLVGLSLQGHGDGAQAAEVITITRWIRAERNWAAGSTTSAGRADGSFAWCTRPSTTRRAVDHRTVQETTHPEGRPHPIRPTSACWAGTLRATWSIRFPELCRRNIDNWRSARRHHVLPGRRPARSCPRATPTPARATPSSAARPSMLPHRTSSSSAQGDSLAGSAWRAQLSVLETQDEWVLHASARQLPGRAGAARRARSTRSPRWIWPCATPPEDAPLPHDHQGPERRRGDVAHVRRGRLRHHPGRRRNWGVHRSSRKAFSGG